jgi:hypothetical protein
MIMGPTGIYNFSSEVLKENPLMEIYHKQKTSGWFPEAILTYSTYVDSEIDTFSHIYSITIKDRIA